MHNENSGSFQQPADQFLPNAIHVHFPSNHASTSDPAHASNEINKYKGVTRSIQHSVSSVERLASQETRRCSETSVETDDDRKPQPRQMRRPTQYNKHEAQDLQKRVRERILQPEPYSVTTYYHDAGFAQCIARNHCFENVTLGVISTNAVWMGFDTDRNTAETFLEADPLFQMVDTLFCIYFTGELCIRFMAFKMKRNCLRDAWFCFDSVLVALMLMETVIFTLMTKASGDDGASPLGNASILRLFRLLRLSRLTRLLRSFPELMVLIKGMATAMKSVSYIMGFLVMVAYVFAIAFTQLSWGDIKEAYFINIGGSLYSLTIHGMFLDDLAPFADDVREVAPWLMLLLSLWIAIGSMTVLNMLVGILCEVVTNVANEEKETRQCNKVKDTFKEILVEADQDDDGLISFGEFSDLMENPEAINALQEVDVDPVGMIDFAQHFFLEKADEEGCITFEDFMEMVLDLRGSKYGTMRDLMLFDKLCEDKLRKLEKKLSKISLLSASPARDPGSDGLSHAARTPLGGLVW